MSKTFFTHTTKLKVVKEGFVPAATIALKKVGDKFYYGVSLCSKWDNFSKKYGREVAVSRLDKEFGVMDIPKPLQNLDEKTACLSQLYNLAASVTLKSKKWKKRITKFNMAQAEKVKGAKIVPITTETN